MDNVYRYFFNVEVMRQSLPFVLNGLWSPSASRLLTIVIACRSGWRWPSSAPSRSAS